MSEAGPTRWSEYAVRGTAQAYQGRFDALAAAGANVHGEADFVADLIPRRGRVLDAGCGTGRVATELTRRGFHCVGVDADPDMIAVARARDPQTTFLEQDLARLQLEGQAFDVAVLAGNVVPLVRRGTLPEVVRRLAGHVHPLGLLVAGFGLDAEHLPPGIPVTPLADYERACGAAGFEPVMRFATWDRQRWDGDAGYVVAVHALR